MRKFTEAEEKGIQEEMQALMEKYKFAIVPGAPKVVPLQEEEEVKEEVTEDAKEDTTEEKAE